MPITDLLNASINSTLSRSIVTHLTVTLALLSLFLFGGQAIHSFTATMMFGVVLVGTYTSIFIASPLLIYLGVGENRGQVGKDEPEETEAGRNSLKIKALEEKMAANKAPDNAQPDATSVVDTGVASRKGSKPQTGKGAGKGGKGKGRR
jgi:preprotein translocase subunit SecF